VHYLGKEESRLVEEKYTDFGDGIWKRVATYEATYERESYIGKPRVYEDLETDVHKLGVGVARHLLFVVVFFFF